MTAADVPIGTPVRVGDVRVGVVTAILEDRAGERAFGLEVTARTGERWFVPWVAATVREDAVEAASALVFGDRNQLDAYARRGARFVRDEGSRRSETDTGGAQTDSDRAESRVSPGIPEGTTVS